MATNKTLSERIVDSYNTGKSDPTELAVLDDITATAAEINLLDGVTATTTELNYVDITTAGTAQPSKAVVTDANKGVANVRDTSTVQIFRQAAPAAKTDTVTLTAAEITGGLLVGTPTAAASYTLPLATDLETALLSPYPGLQVNDSFEFSIINVAATATFDITVITNTGWTLSGNMLVEAREATQVLPSSGVFRVRRTAANAYTLYRVG